MLPASSNGVAPRPVRAAARPTRGFARMNAFSRSRIVLPLASLMTVFALSAHAQAPVGAEPHEKGPPQGGRPPAQAARPPNPHPAGPGGPGAAHLPPGGGPAAAHMPPGG